MFNYRSGYAPILANAARVVLLVFIGAWITACSAPPPPTATPQPTAVPPTATDTETAIPPTATNTRPPTQTPVPRTRIPSATSIPRTELVLNVTVTRILPKTATPTPSNTLPPTLTDTPTLPPTQTFTPTLPPTVTQTQTAAPTTPPTLTLTPTVTPSITLTATLTPTITLTPTPIAWSPERAYVQMILADHPTGYWRLNDTLGTVATDASQGNHPGQYQGKYKLSTGGYGADGRPESVTFSGQGVVTLPGGLPTGSSPRTVELWAKSNNMANNIMLFYGETLDRGYAWEFAQWNSQFSGFFGGGYEVNSGIPITDGSWHFVAITYGDKGTVQIYVDGILAISYTNVVLGANSSGFAIGGGDAGQRNWVGSLAEVAAFDRVLPAERILAQYRAGLAMSRIGPSAPPSDAYGKAVLSAKPAAYWRLDETTGSTAVDLGDGHQVGTYQLNGGSYQLGVPGPQQRPSAYFDGTSYVSLGARGNLPVGASPRSVELWFNAADAASRSLFIYGTSPANGGTWQISRSGANIGLYTGISSVLGATVTTPNRWHQAVVTYDGKTTVQVYVDGKLSGSGTITAPVTGWAFAQIGGPAMIPAWNGGLADVAVYEYVLPATVVSQHYQIGAASPATPEPSFWF